MQILLADDKEVFRRQFKRLPCIRNSGRFHIACEAENGLEVIDSLKRHPEIDVVITDIRMPVKDGLEVLREIREQNLCRCVILLSEYSDFEYAKEGIVYGAFDYIVKPTDDETIEKVLTRAEEFVEGGPVQQYYSRRDVRTAARLLLEKKEDAADYAEKLYHEMAEKCPRKSSLERAWDSFLEDLRGAVLASDPVLDQYVRFTEPPFRPETVPELRGEFRRVLEEIRCCRPDTDNPSIAGLCSKILENIEGDTSLKTMAADLYMNKEYLSHLFHTETGRMYTEYVTGLKMMYARKRLNEPGIRIYDVAASLGFKDTEYFSRVYKKYYGISPSTHRKR